MAGSGQDTVPDFSKRLLALLDNWILHRAAACWLGRSIEEYPPPKNHFGTLKLKVAFTHAFAD